MRNNEGPTKTVNDMTSYVGVLVLGRGHVSHTVKIYYFLKNPFLFSRAKTKQTYYIVD